MISFSLDLFFQIFNISLLILILIAIYKWYKKYRAKRALEKRLISYLEKKLNEL